MITPLPLADVHHRLHAHFHEEDGWSVVGSYETVDREHRAARRAAALFDLSHRVKLEVSGPDRISWLHKLLTNDLLSLTPGQGCYAAFLTPQAKIVAGTHVIVLPDSVLLECEPTTGPRLFEALRKHRITERVEIRDRTREFGLLSIQGPQTSSILTSWAGPAIWPANDLEHRSLHANGMTCLMIRRSLTGDPGIHCLVPVANLPELWEHLLAAGRPFGLTPAGLDALEGLRIEAGLPRDGRDFDDSVLLPEAGLEHAVSHTKGCYIGQEFVARIRDRGHVTRHLVLVALDTETPPPTGSQIHVADRLVGAVTSSAFVSTHQRALAFGFVHSDCAAPGTAVFVMTHGTPQSGHVTTPQIKPVEGPALELPEDHPHNH